ncbi:hypothetical protein ACWF94_02005 [Streptomyces sp. NPDC055078]
MPDPHETPLPRFAPAPQPPAARLPDDKEPAVPQLAAAPTPWQSARALRFGYRTAHNALARIAKRLSTSPHCFPWRLIIFFLVVGGLDAVGVIEP